ncbi:MAG: TonB family protein [Cyclobacteriaceae bacterium]|nr:TonB family protein [Cyclobacteriaceae bacterium]
MSSIINYLIELNLGLVLFYPAYWLLLRNETQFGKKRMFLLIAMICSAVFPLISFPSGNSAIIPTLNETIQAYWLPEIIITTNGTGNSPSSSPGFWNLVMVMYCVISITLVAIIIVRVIKMVILFNNAGKYVWKSYTIAESDKVSGIFSFFHIIFLGSANSLSASEKEEVLRHEEVHIQRLHSFDILLIHVLQAACWFNPVIRFYKISLVQLHEFEADARSAESMDANRYCGLLAKVALQQNGYALANHFTSSFTLKRINMIRTIKKKISQWKVASAFLVLAIYFVTVACQDQLLEDVREVSKNSGMSVEYPQFVKDKIKELSSTTPGILHEYVVIEMNEDGQKKLSSMTDAYKTVHLVKSNDGSGQAYVILEKGDRLNQLAEVTRQDGNVFTVVEETAQPNGGMAEFYKYVASTIKYPTEARRKGAEGRVFVEFVVNEDGSISNVKLLKGIGLGCDEEAARVVAGSPAWQPGKQGGTIVRQRMVVPIVFRIADSKNTIAEEQARENTMTEMVVVGYEKKN